MENYQETLSLVCRGEIQNMSRLPCPIKNKLIDVSNYSVRKGIGNVELAKNILGNLELQDIYLNRNQRLNLASNLKRVLKVVKDIEDGKQCKDELSRYINFKKFLSSGSYGEVSVGNLIDQPKYNKFDFAIKMAHLPRGLHSQAEIHIARLLNDLVFKGRSQNLPVMIDSFHCDSCKFKKLKKSGKCMFMVNEIANGDLESWLKTSPSKAELQSCLFQIMAGVHAFQHYFLLHNNDIKAPNILFYNVNPGGYWKYTIYGRDFYVPNYGKLFIVNDFGVASIYAPKYQLRSPKKDSDVECRLFMINNHKLELIENPAVFPFTRVHWSNSSISNYNPKVLIDKKTNKINYPPVLNEAQKRILKLDPKKPEFYNSNLVPPFRLMGDTQDVLKIFTGGNRMTQGIMGYHTRYNLDETFLKTIVKYLVQTTFSNVIRPLHYVYIEPDLSHILAGYFILDYFTKTVNYTIPKDKDEIISRIITS